MVQFTKGNLVLHNKFGHGTVVSDEIETVIIRFENGIQECDKRDIIKVEKPEESLASGYLYPPIEVILKMQAESIRSINDMWGVFSPSRIALLPHQLWVCRKILENWPTKWLIADDVGLGKTIEAGIILWPLIARGIVRRLLIMCPASLVEQWQFRLRTMFDIRLAIYIPDADKPKLDFWNTHNMVVASLQTLRADNKERHKRIMEAKQWDLVIVDEAHHLNYDETGGGMTLGYALLKMIVEAQKTDSILFFTGTPHRGKNFGFFALLQLLRPDLFDIKKSDQEQYKLLHQVMIRNNKYSVTDLHGNILFQKPSVEAHTYNYSPEEDLFYKMLTDFIASGKAYASTLSSFDGRAVMLVLISMQKLASSSIAAIRKAIKGRMARIKVSSKHHTEALDNLSKKRLEEYPELQKEMDFDELNINIEEVVKIELQLMEDEYVKLNELLDAASQVKNETKIDTIIEYIANMPDKQSVLFFTEYKATQALLMSGLRKRFGIDCVTFINGDDRIEDVEDMQGVLKEIKVKRDDAIDKFNSGNIRFLISTEAGGEGIDLQEQCHYLVHVDLPWNPMRLHQRVGRLNRYGQKEKVEVLLFRNPDTVEARIWNKLNEKINNIMSAFGAVMNDPEDLLQMVLGMTSSSLFDELFTEAHGIKKESLNEWFDKKTAKFGDMDAIKMVKDLIGNVQRFDFQQASDLIPKVDLPDLKPFLFLSLNWNKRQIKEDAGAISFKTPEEWAKQKGVFPTYTGLHFDRLTSRNIGTSAVIGVGHKVFDAALNQALGMASCVTLVNRKILPSPLFIFRIADRITGQTGQIQRVIIGVEFNSSNNNEPVALRDWELLTRLNAMISKPAILTKDIEDIPTNLSNKFHELIDRGKTLAQEEVTKLQLPFKFPLIELVGVLLPND